MLKLEEKFFLGFWRVCEPKADNVNHTRGFSGNDNTLLHRF